MSQPAPGDNASRLNPIFCTRWTCRLGQTLDPRAHQASCNLSPSSLIPTPTCRAGSSHPNPSLSRLTGTCTCDRATQLACALCGRAVIQQLHTVRPRVVYVPRKDYNLQAKLADRESEHVCSVVSCAYIKSPRQEKKKQCFTSIKERKQRRRF
jgi:hypothetical protein